MEVARVPEQAVARLRDGWMDAAVYVDEEGRARLVLTVLDGASVSNDGGVDVSVAASEAVEGVPLVDVLMPAQGRRPWNGRRYAQSQVGSRLRYVSHDLSESPPWRCLDVVLRDEQTGLQATVGYRLLAGRGVLRSTVTATNDGEAALTIDALSSLLVGDLAGRGGDLHDVDILFAENDWQAEARWKHRHYREVVPTLGDVKAYKGECRGRFTVTNIGTWSTGAYLPMGAAVNRRSGRTLLWQIENNGAWHWEVGDLIGEPEPRSYLALLGPTDIEHHWRVRLAPGESFQTVPVALAVSPDGVEQAAQNLTRYRRVIRRDHEDLDRLPVIFNDFMQTLLADPSPELLIPLIDAAAEAGAEYFCIDAGWYAPPGAWWWDTVGEWVPSESRFPGGLAKLTARIRDRGMVPGLWIEPEVVGVRSPIAASLPDEAFFMRDGERIVEQDRHHLDLRHPAAREHLDRAIDFLVEELGIGYIKMDYNIDIAPGTDVGGDAPGAGMLGHNRALLDWATALLDRHPQLTLESCASGGMRSDYAMLVPFQLHSTSDQDDPLYYPPIAAAAAIGIAPDQAAVWAPPQPEMSDDMIAFTVCGSLLSRVHLSGHLDHMSAPQRRIIAEGIEVYKRIRSDLPDAVPFWPLGLPRWDDAWLAMGMRTDARSYVIVWRRFEEGPTSVSMTLTGVETGPQPRVLYPDDTAELDWDEASGTLRVELARCPTACLIVLDGDVVPAVADPTLSAARRAEA